MARKNNGKNNRNNGRKNGNGRKEIAVNHNSLGLHPETKQTLWGIACVALMLLFIFAGFKSAGPAGNFIYSIFEKFFGKGYFLLPLILLLLAIVFFASHSVTTIKIPFIGAGIFILAGLGLIDITLKNGGWLGKILGWLEHPFGKPFAIIIIVAIFLSSLIAVFNVPIKFRRKEKLEEDFSELNVKELKIPQGLEEEQSAPIKPEQDKKNVKPLIPLKSKSMKIKGYTAPPFSLLRSSVEKPTSGDLRANANIIKRTLESFGIPVEMGEINIGPKVTRYTLKPAEGIKLSRITALNQDLALSLAAHPIRIEAPIPGKSLVGIEVPNKAAAIVRLGSLMAYPEFSKSGLLSFPLGRDVSGEIIFSDIEKMPHLLVAGSTGSGKSICIHSLLISLIYKNSPETLKLLLIDPKRVELSIYENIPHLLTPPITDLKKSVGVFRWALSEMDRRYDLLQASGSRDVQSFNKKKPEEALPFLVIVIDELADLMTTYGREVESSIVRLAQMARATGIHLVLSTQRPSVEVVTGLIKANITARVALQVPSQVDSRTILDTSGAEKLLGGGDMLFISSEFSKPKRIQGAYVSEEEAQKVTDFIRENNDIVTNGSESIDFEPDQVENFLSDFDANGGEDDELLDEAIEIIYEAKKASASLLQRHLKVGYARAARLLDILQAKGLIGPGSGAKPRDVYFEKINNLKKEDFPIEEE
ncbi:MAG: DNA translocase FtsK [Candidatus Paceibacterota bacterium]|jgi:S-DNA-T family DNA segregation ATPase FtsK/SpoIIIE